MMMMMTVMMIMMTPPVTMVMTNWRNASGGELLTETFHSHTQEMQEINFSSQAQLLCMSYIIMYHFLSSYICILQVLFYS